MYSEFGLFGKPGSLALDCLSLVNALISLATPAVRLLLGAFACPRGPAPDVVADSRSQGVL